MAGRQVGSGEVTQVGSGKVTQGEREGGKQRGTSEGYVGRETGQWETEGRRRVGRKEIRQGGKKGRRHRGRETQRKRGI